MAPRACQRRPAPVAKYMEEMYTSYCNGHAPSNHDIRGPRKKVNNFQLQLPTLSCGTCGTR
ncbi:hypothetical protein SCLCIDRAFT_1223654 [Scleroderma citrinum Foug A]|uniref:Uncharacterized protein n=1 Tax=Scleroderma citrinum Foug A TaxID=1036808 RepID=A0A0C3D8T5_9AGAM|nr:hypothetical protein SCLCIDRAFT_1223654 [Scleroderma citrinum Foug A]